jgi:hypothetical protein
MSMRSVNFGTTTGPIQNNELAKPRAAKPNGHALSASDANTVQDSVQSPGKPNALNALHGARVHSQIIFDKMKPLIDSENRHGDLQVIRSAAKNLITHIDVLIQAEEES